MEGLLTTCLPFHDPSLGLPKPTSVLPEGCQEHFLAIRRRYGRSVNCRFLFHAASSSMMLFFVFHAFNNMKYPCTAENHPTMKLGCDSIAHLRMRDCNHRFAGPTKTEEEIRVYVSDEQFSCCRHKESILEKMLTSFLLIASLMSYEASNIDSVACYKDLCSLSPQLQTHVFKSSHTLASFV